MTRAIYYTASTLDGFIADEHDSLAWLDEQHEDPDLPSHYGAFIAGIGAVAMGATTYAWVVEQLTRSGEAWPYEMPSFVFTHRPFEAYAEGIAFVSGPVADHRARLEEAAGDRDVWVAGGGDLAGQFADAGFLDQVIVSIAPVTLGAGRPLFPRRHDLRLTETARNGDFVVATYDVVGARSD